VSSAIEDLHVALFGFRPAKAGTAYERLAAVVLATLGWEGVVHDTTETAPGKLAGHQLDVTGRHPSGEIKRLIVECKDWDEVVGQGTLDTLVGVLAQVEADAAAVMTTKGYTSGAIDVAVDQDIAVLRLRPFDPENPDLYVKTITFTLEPVGSVYEDWDVELMPEAGLPSGTTFQIAIGGTDHLLHLDGSPAETVAEIIEAQKTTLEEGSYPRRAEFPDGRLLPTTSGDRLPIAALTWTERVVKSKGHPTVVQMQGEPVLILEQLNERGELEHGRVVVDQDLYAWDIDAEGNVTQRGKLTGGPDGNTDL
jgi:hypothetical protein